MKRLLQKNRISDAIYAPAIVHMLSDSLPRFAGAHHHFAGQFIFIGKSLNACAILIKIMANNI